MMLQRQVGDGMIYVVLIDLLDQLVLELFELKSCDSLIIVLHQLS